MQENAPTTLPNLVQDFLQEHSLHVLSKSKRELKERIKTVRKNIAFNLSDIPRTIKMFAGRLRTVKEREGHKLL